MKRERKLHQVAWLNRVLELMWPALNKATSDTILFHVNDLLKEPANLPSYVTKMELNEHLSLGVEPPLITGIRVRDRPDASEDLPNPSRVDPGALPAADTPLGVMILDLDLEWTSIGTEIELRVYRDGMHIPISLTALTLTGTLRVQFDPLVGQWPSFAMLGTCFVEPPDLDVQLDVNDIQVMALPMLKEKIKALLSGLLKDYFTLPNMVPAPDWRDLMAPSAHDSCFYEGNIYANWSSIPTPQDDDNAATKSAANTTASRDPSVPLNGLSTPRGSKHSDSLIHDLFAEIDGVTEQIGKVADDLAGQVDEEVGKMRRATVNNIETTGKAFSEMLDIMKGAAEITSLEVEQDMSQDSTEVHKDNARKAEDAYEEVVLDQVGTDKIARDLGAGQVEMRQVQQGQPVPRAREMLAAAAAQVEVEDAFFEADMRTVDSEEEPEELAAVGPFAHLTGYREAWMEKGGLGT
jgi:hypothetical protein